MKKLTIVIFLSIINIYGQAELINNTKIKTSLTGFITASDKKYEIKSVIAVKKPEYTEIILYTFKPTPEELRILKSSWLDKKPIMVIRLFNYSDKLKGQITLFMLSGFLPISKGTDCINGLYQKENDWMNISISENRIKIESKNDGQVGGSFSKKYKWDFSLNAPLQIYSSKKKSPNKKNPE